MIPSLLICCTYYITSIYIIQLMHNACFDYLSFNLYYFISVFLKIAQEKFDYTISQWFKLT